MLSNIKTEKDLTPEFMASVLKATHQSVKWKTIYSAVYDLQELRIYLYYNRQFHKPYILDVEKELAKIAPHKYFSLISLNDLGIDAHKLFLN
jgi:hypothetical protein